MVFFCSIYSSEELFSDGVLPWKSSAVLSGPFSHSQEGLRLRLEVHPRCRSWWKLWVFLQLLSPWGPSIWLAIASNHHSTTLTLPFTSLFDPKSSWEFRRALCGFFDQVRSILEFLRRPSFNRSHIQHCLLHFFLLQNHLKLTAKLSSFSRATVHRHDSPGSFKPVGRVHCK